MSVELVAAIEAAPLPSIGDGRTFEPLVPLLSGGVGDHLAGIPPSRQMECLSGLWLVAGDIHRSHEISQDLPSPEGSFWHGIMHRREADFGNSKYWFRKVGQHPALEQIATETNGHYDDPYSFVDHVHQVVRSGEGSAIRRCEESQWVEWQALMVYLAD